MRGAYFDIFALKWDKKLFPNEKFIYVDCNALYSYICANYPFMTGKYKVIMGADIRKIEIQNNLFYFNNNKISGGALLLTISAPNDLFYHFYYIQEIKILKLLILCVNFAVKMK